MRNVGMGDFDMSGDQLTIEAVFCRTTAYDPAYLEWGRPW